MAGRGRGRGSRDVRRGPQDVGGGLGGGHGWWLCGGPWAVVLVGGTWDVVGHGHGSW